MHEQSLALRQPPARENIVVDGEVIFRNARRLQHGERLGARQAEGCVGQRIFGIAAGTDQRTDFVAHFQIVDVRPERDDAAGDFESGHLRFARRRRIGAGALRAIRPVDSEGCDLDENLAGAGRGNVCFRKFDHFRAARAVENHLAHFRGQCGHGFISVVPTELGDRGRKGNVAARGWPV